MGGTIEGVGLKLRRARRIRVGWWLLVLLPAGVVFALCYRPVMRLRPAPPPGFAETGSAWDATRQAAEARAAEAYWQLALNIVQWKFPFGTELPLEPIAEFRLDEKDFPRSGIAAAPATRARYWKKLREMWSSPQIWNRAYVWNSGWLWEALLNFTEAVSRFVHRITRAFS
jgi:hypothetical protein